MLLHLLLLLQGGPLAQGGPPALQQALEQALPRAAKELAQELVEDLGGSGELAREGISEFALPGILGDSGGVLRDQLVPGLVNTLQLRRIAEDSERDDLTQHSYRKSGFEAGLFDPESLKRLGGHFLDNQGLFGARVYGTEDRLGLRITAHVELWDVRRAAVVWAGTATRLAAAEDVMARGDEAKLGDLLRQADLLADDRERANAALERLQRNTAAAEDAAAKEQAAREAAAAAKRAADAEQKAREDAERRRRAWWIGLGLAAVVVLYALIRLYRLRLQTLRARARGEQVLARQGWQKSAQDDRVEGARRAQALADRLSEAAARAPEAVEPAALRRLAERLQRFGRTLAAAPSGGPAGPVELKGDPSAAAAGRVAGHDAETLVQVQRLEGVVEGLLAAAREGVAVSRSGVRAAEELLDALERRLGEREDLVRETG